MRLEATSANAFSCSLPLPTSLPTFFSVASSRRSAISVAMRKRRSSGVTSRFLASARNVATAFAPSRSMRILAASARSAPGKSTRSSIHAAISAVFGSPRSFIAINAARRIFPNPSRRSVSTNSSSPSVGASRWNAESRMPANSGGWIVPSAAFFCLPSRFHSSRYQASSPVSASFLCCSSANSRTWSSMRLSTSCLSRFLPNCADRPRPTTAGSRTSSSAVLAAMIASFSHAAAAAACCSASSESARTNARRIAIVRIWS